MQAYASLFAVFSAFRHFLYVDHILNHPNLHMSFFCCTFASGKFKSIRMRKWMIGLMAVVAITAQAQISTILGDWKTVDDKTNEQRSVDTIYQGEDGLYYGKISKMLMYADLLCEACTDADHNAPLQGLVIIRGMRFDAKENALVGGKVLDPESGKFYFGKIYPKDGHLVLRGSLDKFGVLGRNQTWVR